MTRWKLHDESPDRIPLANHLPDLFLSGRDENRGDERMVKVGRDKV